MWFAMRETNIEWFNSRTDIYSVIERITVFYCDNTMQISFVAVTEKIIFMIELKIRN